MDLAPRAANGLAPPDLVPDGLSNRPRPKPARTRPFGLSPEQRRDEAVTKRLEARKRLTIQVLDDATVRLASICSWAVLPQVSGIFILNAILY